MTRPGGIAALRERFDAELAIYLKEQREHVLSLHPDLEPLVDEVVQLTLAGGKRLRPTFCYWGFRGGGGADGPDIVRAALALELLHTFALLHDDIMDGSRTRKFRPSAWLSLGDLHTRSAWRRGRHDFGVSAAILAGDLALMWADDLFGSTPLAPERVLAGLELFTTMRVEVTAGQYLDLVEAHRGHTDEVAARKVCTLKSGRYTVERPLQIGLALAGGDAALHEAFATYGNPLGQAFQIRDDVLGVFGDPGTAGKPNDDDFREGKETVLVAKARHAAAPSDRAALDRFLGAPDLDDHGVAELRRILVESGALEETLRLIDALVSEAIAGLEGAALAAPVRDALVELAEYVGQRDR